jgi:hypothetical protein
MNSKVESPPAWSRLSGISAGRSAARKRARGEGRGWILGLSAENFDPSKSWESTKGWTVVDGLQSIAILGASRSVVIQQIA